jgi:hypothetical protein
MKNKRLYLIFTLVITQNIFAAKIFDKKGILPISDNFVGAKSFEESLQCEDYLRYEKNHCQKECTNPQSCQTTCRPTEEHVITVEDCRENSVLIVRQDPWDKIHRSIFTKEDYMKAKGNYVRFRLGPVKQHTKRSQNVFFSLENPQAFSSNSKDEIHIMNHEYLAYEAPWGEENIMRIHVKILVDSGFFGWKIPFHYQFDVGENLSFLNQMLRGLSSTGTEETPDYKLLEFDRR